MGRSGPGHIDTATHVDRLPGAFPAKSVCVCVELAKALNVAEEALVERAQLLLQRQRGACPAQPRYRRRPLLPSQVAHARGAHRPRHHKQRHVARLDAHIGASARRGGGCHRRRVARGCAVPMRPRVEPSSATRRIYAAGMRLLALARAGARSYGRAVSAAQLLDSLRAYGFVCAVGLLVRVEEGFVRGRVPACLSLADAGAKGAHSVWSAGRVGLDAYARCSDSRATLEAWR